MSVKYNVIQDDEYATILKETYSKKFSIGYLDINGTTMMPRYSADMAQNVLNFEVHDTDVWVIGFPKTGTTWAREMTWMIANDLNYEIAKEDLLIRFPFLELSSMYDTSEVSEKLSPPQYLKDSVTFARNMKDPRFLKTHLPWDLLPTQIQNGSTKAKIIYVTRNPKDTCLSYYYHAKVLHGYTGSFDDFVKLFLAGKINYGHILRHVQSFWEHRNEPNICFVKYEDMKNDLKGAIRKIATFLEKKLTDEQVNRLEKHLSFESMKYNPYVNYEDFFKLVNLKGSFMRSGTVGSYKQMMSSELIEKFDKWTLENTKGTGFSFDA